MTAIENIINQIENETRRFGNTKTRVAAVLRLIKAKLVELFSGKLDKGRYTGTADDLNNAIGNKVDKVPGRYSPPMTSRMNYVQSWRDYRMWIYLSYYPREAIQGLLKT